MQTFIARAMTTFIADYQKTRRLNSAWGAPLVGFAAADDPLMAKLKSAVSPSHALPQDLLADVSSVIVYFIPFAKDIPRSNRHERMASREWALAYIETNRLIVAVNEHLAQQLDQKGYASVLLPPTHNFDKEKLISDWSHKHLAYIAGLGNFGVHHLLITAKGCCGRLGSLVTNMHIPASERKEGEACLHRFNGSCLKCVAKCVAGALEQERFDRQRCYQLLLENAARFEKEGLADVCGKCTCVVPCSFHNPVTRAKRSQAGNQEKVHCYVKDSSTHH